MKKFFLIVATTLLFAACKEIKTQDGRIPEQYRPQAQTYLGHYLGQIENTKTAMAIDMNAEGLVNLNFTNDYQNDILEPKCKSLIGNLQSIYVTGDESNPTLARATFSFDPNLCGLVEGRQIHLNFSNKEGHISAGLRLLERTTWHSHCTHSGPHHQPDCSQETSEYFIRGNFDKID